MKFGAKEVMVVAALAFGIMAAGCSSSGISLAMDPQVRAMNAGGLDYKIYFSEYEMAFCYPDGWPAELAIRPAREAVEVPASEPVTGGAAGADSETCSVATTWTPSLPAFLK